MRTIRVHLLILVLCLAAYPATRSVAQVQGRSPVWSVDCANLKTSRWFIIDERESAKSPGVFIGNSITVVGYPGLHDVEDVHDDPRIRWISADEITVSNDDEDVGWEGRLVFHRCVDAR